MTDLDFVQALIAARKDKNRAEFERVLTTEGHYERLLDIALRGCGASGITKNAPRAPRKPKQGNLDGTFALPAWIPLPSWTAYVEMRKKIKAPLTAHAMELCVKKLEKMRADGMDAGAVLDQSVERSYRGLFSVKSDSQPYSGPGQGSNVAPFISAQKWLGRLEIFYGLDSDQRAGTWQPAWGDRAGVPEAVLTEFDRLHPGVRSQSRAQG